MEVDGQVGYLKNELIHNPFPDFSEYLVKANRYSSLLAKEYKQHSYFLYLLLALRIILIRSKLLASSSRIVLPVLKASLARAEALS